MFYHYNCAALDVFAYKLLYMCLPKPEYPFDNTIPISEFCISFLLEWKLHRDEGFTCFDQCNRLLFGKYPVPLPWGNIYFSVLLTLNLAVTCPSQQYEWLNLCVHLGLTLAFL